MESALLRALLASMAAALFLLAPPAHAAQPPAHAAKPRVLAIHFDSDVNPVTQDWVNSKLNRAGKKGYDAAVIVLDTPGGLSESMRKIYKKELASKIPVLVYVSPNGARAASAGVWIGMAADVLAMAPQTNIGSSTPITGSGQDLGKDLRRKVVNDAAASLRYLAASHGRNAHWVDRAVREASNITASEAKRINVIDAIAPSLPALLTQLDGYRTKPKGFELHLGGASIDEVRMGFFTRVLNTLIDPNLISLLFLAGIAGVGFEIFHPGVVLPGALGAVALVAALFGFSVLPISWAGVVLILLGLFLLVADVHVTSHGALTVSGLTSLIVGLLLLFHDAPSPYHTSVPLIISVGGVLGAFWLFVLTKALGARRRPVSVGPQTIVGQIGEVRRGGLVFVQGELWSARTSDGSHLEPGQKVQVEQLDGIALRVRPV